MTFRWPWSKKSTSTMDLVRELMESASSASGVPVNWKTALQASTSLGCARVIAEDIAQVPLKLYQKASDGGAELATEHPLYDVLSVAPNEWQTSFEWREMVGLHCAFAGNHYSYINRVRNQVVELIPFEPGAVETKRDDLTTKYQVTRDNGTKFEVSSENMLHIRWTSWNGWSGLDGVKLAREAIGLAIATETHGSKMFKNGATIPGIVSTEQNLDEDTRKALRSSFEQAQSGLDNAWKILVLWGGLEYKQAGATNDQAQLLETRRLQVEEVCRAFKVLPIMVGHADKAATYASVEQMFLAHVTKTMGPWYSRLEQAFNSRLLSKEERVGGLYTKFSVQGLLRGSHEARANYYNTLFNLGALNPNEIRELEEMNPYDGGDTYMTPLNMGDASGGSSSGNSAN